MPLPIKHRALAIVNLRPGIDGAATAMLELMHYIKRVGFEVSIFNFLTGNPQHRTLLAARIAAGYEDCNNADFLRIDPALRLALGKDHRLGASQFLLSRLENDVLGNPMGLEALDGALTRATDALLKRKNKRRQLTTTGRCWPGGHRRLPTQAE